MKLYAVFVYLLVGTFAFHSTALNSRANDSADEGLNDSLSYGVTAGLLGGGIQPVFGLFAEKRLSKRFTFGPFLLVQPHFASTVLNSQNMLRQESYLSAYLGLNLNFNFSSRGEGLWAGVKAGLEYCTLNGCVFAPFVGPALGYDFRISNNLILSPEISLFHRLSGGADANSGGILLNLKGF